jgi:hypothetical protein
MILVQRFSTWESSAPLKGFVTLLEHYKFTVMKDEKIYTPNNKIQWIHYSTNIHSIAMCVRKVQLRRMESEGTGAPQKSQRVAEFLNQ